MRSRSRAWTHPLTAWLVLAALPLPAGAWFLHLARQPCEDDWLCGLGEAVLGVALVMLSGLVVAVVALVWCARSDSAARFVVAAVAGAYLGLVAAGFLGVGLVGPLASLGGAVGLVAPLVGLLLGVLVARRGGARQTAPR